MSFASANSRTLLLFLIVFWALNGALPFGADSLRAESEAPDTTEMSPLQKLLYKAKQERESGVKKTAAAEPAPEPLPASVTRLTETEGGEGEPRWSPDGSALYYVYREGVKGEVRRLDLASGEYEVITQPGSLVEHFDLDPTGEYIAYAARTDLGKDIWILRISDGATAKLTDMSEKGSETYPCYNHSGKKIYYALTPSGSHKQTPMVILRDGEQSEILLDVEGMHSSPALSGDGESLVWYYRQGATGLLRIFNTQITALYEDLVFPDHVIGSIAWAPGDQQLLLALVDRSNPLIGYDLYLFPLAGGSPRLLINLGKNDLDGRFSPDGSRIAFRSDWAGQDDLFLYALP